MSILLALLACALAGMALAQITALAKGINELRVRIDVIERKKKIVEPDYFDVVYTAKGTRKQFKEKIVCSDESDAMRQLLLRGIDPSRIVTLERGKSEEE